MEDARAMVYQKELTNKLYSEACNIVVYVLNHTGPTPIEDKTLHEMWYGKPENFSVKHLRIFGTKRYVHETKQRCQIWDKKGCLLDMKLRMDIGYFHIELKIKI